MRSRCCGRWGWSCSRSIPAAAAWPARSASRPGKYAVSQAVGERVLLPAVRAAAAGTVIVSDGFSCREQIQQATGRRAMHVAEVLQMAMTERITVRLRARCNI